MDTTIVRLSPESLRTRLLVTRGGLDIAKAILPSPSRRHPRAMPTLLEGLSLFMEERLCVVLCVDDDSTSSCELGLLDGLGYGTRNLFYEVGIAARLSHRRRRQAHSVSLPKSSFRDLRQLSWEQAR